MREVRTPEGEELEVVTEIIERHLFHAVEAGAEEVGCSGLSFVLAGMACWGRELVEIDRAAARDLFDAWARLMAETGEGAAKRRAEEDRAKAVRRLFHAANLMFSVPEGRA